MKFIGHKSFFCDDLGWVGVSLGLHVSAYRIDIHVLKWVFSFGRVPVYEGKKGNLYAVSNSFHESKKQDEYLRPRI